MATDKRDVEVTLEKSLRSSTEADLGAKKSPLEETPVRQGSRGKEVRRSLRQGKRLPVAFKGSCPNNWGREVEGVRKRGSEGRYVGEEREELRAL